jgi:hypothetical protein
MLIKNELRNTNGTGTIKANELAQEAQDFAEIMLQKYGNFLSADAIAFCIISAVHGTSVMAVAMEAIEQKT